MKRLLTVLLALALLFTLAACGSAGGGTTDAENISAVDSRVDGLFESADYTGADDAGKLEKIDGLLAELSESALIDAGSVEYSEEELLYTFRYECGVYGGISLAPLGDETDGSGAGRSDALSAAQSGGANASALILNGFEATAFRRDYYVDIEAEWESEGLDTAVDTDVTVDDLKSLEGGGLIVFAMHGNTYGGDPILSLSQKVTALTDWRYSRELKTRQIAKVYCTDNQYHYWVFSTLFSENYSAGDFSDTVIFVQCCKFFGCDCISRTPDTSFADVFISLSATAVVGYHNSVLSVYGRDLMNDLVHCLIAGDTVSGALDTAVAENGATDGYEDASDDKYEAYPVCVGDGRLSDFSVPASGEPAEEEALYGSAYDAYRALLESYSWVSYAPESMGLKTMQEDFAGNDPSEICYGEYSLFDIDGDGTDELIILSGQALADMGRLVFTWRGGKLVYLGDFGSYGGLFGCLSGGIAVESAHGGIGNNYYAWMIDGALVTELGDIYNYEEAGWVSEFASDEWVLLESYPVQDLSPLG